MTSDRSIWDEYEWEEFIAAEDRMRERCLELLFRGRYTQGRSEQIMKVMGMSWCASCCLEDEEEECDEWKRLQFSERLCSMGTENIRAMPVLCQAGDFSLLAAEGVGRIPESCRQNSSVVDFLSNAGLIAASIAIGHEVGEPAGNIAYCKRALRAANLVLDALREMKKEGILMPPLYDDLAEEATELRNAVALYVADVRERFRFEC